MMFNNYQKTIELDQKILDLWQIVCKKIYF